MKNKFKGGFAFMPYKTKRCKIEGCGKGGAYSFNSLCAQHWDALINENIKKIIIEIKKGNQK